MLANAFAAFLHFIAVLGVFGTVFYEWLTFSATPTLTEARRLRKCDTWYGIFAGLLLVVGFLRVFYFEKGPAYYFHNPFFHLKLTLFIVMGLLSIYPTIKFIRWGPQLAQGAAPVVAADEARKISRVLKIEMHLMVGIVLCASLMAKGVGF